MRKLPLLFSSLVCLFTSVANAGGQTVGDGGHGVVCNVQRFPAVELLDLHEARIVMGFQPSFNDSRVSRNGQGPRGRNFGREFSEALKRLTTIMPKDSEFNKLLEKSKNLTFRSTHSRLNDTNDVEPIPHLVAEGCKVVQLALRVSTQGRTEVVIDHTYWSRLDNNSRAALYLHEMLHSWFAQGSRPRSNLPIRQLVALLSTPRFYREPRNDLAKEIIESRSAVDIGVFRSYPYFPGPLF